MKNAAKKGAAIALAFALLALLPAVTGIFAAGAVDVEKKCSVTFRLEGLEAEQTELGRMEIPIAVYRVADINAEGRYKALSGFEKLDFSKISANTTAQQWQDMAETAIEAVEAGNMAPDAETTLHGADGGAGKIEGLGTGMYLVLAQTVQSPEYSYAFAPYLLSLPNNYYYETQDDAWSYDVTSELKPDQTVRYGSLEIVKTLDAYNASLGDACFVFQVEAVRGSQTVYSNAFAVNFNAPGEQRLTIEHIPAGTQVTVTEAYSGASYQALGEAVQHTVVLADGEEGAPASVTFANTYDERRNTGTAIVNHFTCEDGKWDVTQQKPQAGQQ